MNDSSRPAAGAAASDDSGALPRMSARRWILVSVGLLVAILLVGAYALLSIRAQPVRFQDVGFSVDGPQSATSTFDVFFYDEGVATCTVRALNAAYGEVGVASVEVDSADGSQQRVSLEVATTEEAVTATVQSCTLAPSESR